MICGASIYRNGGTDARTHLCDDCLRIGLRAMKVAISELLAELDGDFNKDEHIVYLTSRLAHTQHHYGMVCFDHNRMQGRLKDVLPQHDENESEDMKMARWEANRPKAREEF